MNYMVFKSMVLKVWRLPGVMAEETPKPVEGIGKREGTDVVAQVAALFGGKVTAYKPTDDMPEDWLDVLRTWKAFNTDPRWHKKLRASAPAGKSTNAEHDQTSQ